MKILKVIPLALILNCGGLAFAAAAPALDPEVISQSSGAKAAVASGGVIRIEWPRSDVTVKVDGAPLPPAAGLGTWAAFEPGEGGAMMMGDTVVFEDEVDAAMDAAFANGLDVTALHNHFFHDDPPVYFMHIHGHGEPQRLAAAVKAVWDAIKKVRAGRPLPEDHFAGKPPVAGQIDPKEVERLTGLKAKVISPSLVKVSIGHEVSMHGMKVIEPMGANTWAAFSGDQAAASMDGDFAMTAEEVPAVLKTLRARGVHIVALHNHMFGEAPALFFTHFWGKGGVDELADAFAAALKAQHAAAGGQ